MKKLLFILLFLPFFASALDINVSGPMALLLNSDSLKANNRINKGWRFHEDTDSLMYRADYDDATWLITDAGQFYDDDGKAPPLNGVAWFRFHFWADTNITGRPITFQVAHMGASEIYLDGILLKKWGKIAGPDSSVYYDPQDIPLPVMLTRSGSHVIAIRYANYAAKKNFERLSYDFAGFTFRVGELEININEKVNNAVGLSFILVFILSIFFTIFIVHMLMFLFYRSIKSNLYFSLFMLFLSALFFIAFEVTFSHDPQGMMSAFKFVDPLFCLGCISLTSFIHDLFTPKKGIRYRVIIGIGLLAFLINFVYYDFADTAVLIIVTISALDAILTIVKAMIRKVTGAWIIGTGILFFILFILTIVLLGTLNVAIHFSDESLSGELALVFFVIAILSIPISMSVFLARNFARISKDLKGQLQQVSMLSQKSLEQEQEKLRIISNQNEMLEQKVEARTQALKETQGQLVQQEKLASLGALTAGIAHEIKNPLNFVTNFSELSEELLDELKDASTEEQRKEVIELLQSNLAKINHHGKRADSIVKSMLEHSRSNSGEKQSSDINKLCDEFVNLAYHGMRANVPNFNCTLEKQLADDLPQVPIVQQDISRVILNLLNNAFYAVKEKSDRLGSAYNPVVSVKTTLSNQRVSIIIRDNGSGIPEQLKKKIFEPFFTTKPSGQGTGLGLSLSYDIIKAHGGSMQVESKEDEFTEFRIVLPL